MRTNSLAKEEIQRPPILEVIEQYVELRKIGREFWGLCPFHSEKTASFAVNVEKDLFYCPGVKALGATAKVRAERQIEDHPLAIEDTEGRKPGRVISNIDH